MRWMILVLTTIFLGACAAARGSQPTPIDTARPTESPLRDAPPPLKPTPTLKQEGFHADLLDLGAAPELNNEVWLNTDRPVRLADVRGKVVVLDMWTFG